MSRRFSRERLQAELEAVAARHGLELLKVDGQGVLADPERDLFAVRLIPIRAAADAPEDDAR